MEKGTDICLAEIAFLILRNIPNGYSKEEKEAIIKKFGKGYFGGGRLFRI